MAKKSERYKIRELELEHEIVMQREKALLEFALTPPGTYLIGLGGSLVLTYLQALLTPKDERTPSMEDMVKRGLSAIMGAPFGVAGIAISDWLNTGESPITSLMKMSAAGSTGLFTALLILNEMKPEGGSSQGGILGAMTGGMV